MTRHDALSRDPGVLRIRTQLEHLRTRVSAGGSLLLKAYQHPPPGPGIAGDRGTAIKALRKAVQDARVQVSAIRAGTAAAKNAQKLTVRALVLFDRSLAKLADAAMTRDQDAAVVRMSDGLKLLEQAKAASLKAGRTLPGGWPL